MISIIALYLRTYIVRIISATLRTQRTNSFRSEQLFGHNIKHLFLLCTIQRRIIKRYGKYHVRTYTPIHHITVYIIKQITIFVTEYLDKRLSGYFCLRIEFIRQVYVSSFAQQISYKTQRIIPQRIKFNNIPRTRNHRMSVHCRIHPCNRLIRTVGKK